MAIPPVEIAWEGDYWTPEHQVSLATPVKSALWRAEEAINFLGLSSDIPKTALLRRKARDRDPLGECEGATRFRLYYGLEDIMRANRRGSIDTVVDTSTHELAHCIRAERFSYKKNILEFIATEGLAETAQCLAKLTDPANYHHWADTALPADRANLWKQMLLTNSEEPFDDVFRAWFGRTKDGLRGSKLGIWCVSELLKEGCSLPEVMDMPAEQIVGVSYEEAA